MMPAFLKNIIEYFRNQKIKNKLMLSYLILIIIPMLTLAFIYSKMVSDFMENQIKYSALQAFEQTNSFINSKLSSIINVSDIICTSIDVNDILLKSPSGYNLAQQYLDANKLSLFFSNFERNGNIYRARLYVKDGLSYSNEHVNFFSVKSIEGSDWYGKLKSSKDKLFWCPPEYFSYNSRDSKKVISTARIIRNINNFSENIGVLKIDILESSMREILENSNITHEGLVCLLNSDGIVIASSSNYKDEGWGMNKDFYGKLDARYMKWDVTDLNGQKVIIGYEAVKNTDWKLVSIIPLKEILLAGERIKKYMLAFMVLISIVIYVMAYYISYSSTRRINLLIKEMRKVQGGDLSVSISEHSRDEIGELITSFNYMTRELSVLVQEKYDIGKEVKNYELKALQAQINPHFLYNTLDLINWTAIKYNMKDICFIVNSLAKFYKLSLSKGKDIISILDEIEHVKTYIDIQNRRFDNRIGFLLDIDRELYDYSTLKLLLQPLVENSILHGIFEKDEKTGTVRITGKMENDEILLSIHDDGVGIPEDRMQSILSSGTVISGSGYGISNINKRIKLYYGSQYGLNYRSIKGTGTTVEIRIPALKYKSS